MEYLKLIDIKNTILENIKDTNKKIGNINKETDLNRKLLLLRYYSNSQSGGIIFEKIFIKKYGFTKTPKDSVGDIINDKKEICELKYSGFVKKQQFNFVQLRPHQHNIISYYYLVVYNIFELDLGKTYIFKIPSKIIEELIIKYGSYAHGSKKINGDISKDNFKNFEYALRPKIGSDLWKNMLIYIIN
jgi:hypothetical protein